MARAQLNLRLPLELLERLQRTATAADTTVAELVRGWILAGLDDGLAASSAPSTNGLDKRLAAVEARLAALEAAPPPEPAPTPRTGDAGPLLALLQAAPVAPAAETAPPAVEEEPPRPSVVDAPLPQAAGAGLHEGEALTVVELAARTGTNQKGWVNWAQGKRPGAVRVHPQAGSWELLGKRPDPRGGPDRLLFRRA